MINLGKKINIQKPQRGMAVIAAIFLIVVLAALGIFAITIGGAQQQTVNLDLLGDRAVAAANSAIESGAFRARAAGSCGPATGPRFQLTEASLNGFMVQVTACVGTAPAGGRPFTITATAFNGAYGSPDYVWRTVTRVMP